MRRTLKDKNNSNVENILVHPPTYLFPGSPCGWRTRPTALLQLWSVFAVFCFLPVRYGSRKELAISIQSPNVCPLHAGPRRIINDRLLVQDLHWRFSRSEVERLSALGLSDLRNWSARDLWVALLVDSISLSSSSISITLSLSPSELLQVVDYTYGRRHALHRVQT